MATTPNKGYELQLTGSNRGRWGVFINNILSQIDNNISAFVEVDCAGSADITISSDEAENIYQKMTGILTGDIEVIYPDKGSFFFIENATTGNFTLKVVNVALGTGVVIAQGDVALVYTDSASNKVVLIDNGISTTINTLKNEIKTVYVPTVGGTANAITLTPTTPITAYSAGQIFRFKVAATNTIAAVQANVSGVGLKDIKKTIGGAIVALSIGDLPANTMVDIQYDGTQLQLMNIRSHGQGADIASSATLNLDTATGDYVVITGTTTITAVTLAQGRKVTCRFAAGLTITHGASLICPGARSILTIDGEIIEFIGEASGVVRVNAYASKTYLIPTGQISGFARKTAPAGWLILNGGTIGSAASGATSRANADTFDLFEMRWNEYANTEAAIQDSAGAASSRGASAAADFAANKRMPLEDWVTNGVFMRSWDTVRVFGTYEADALKAHNHTYNRDNGAAGASEATTGARGTVAAATSTTGDTETRPKNRVALMCIKL